MIEARPRHGRDAHFFRHPFREFDVVLVAELREIREDVVGAFGNGEVEPCFAERVDQHRTA